MTISGIDFREVGLEHPDVKALVQSHREDLARHSPRCSVHALQPDAFTDPTLTLLTAWDAGTLIGCGALKRHSGKDAGLGELKTMRTVDAHRGRGVGEALLERLMAFARSEGLTRLALETGTGKPFAPAITLYRKHGFVTCEAFATYAPDPLSTFLARSLRS